MKRLILFLWLACTVAYANDWLYYHNEFMQHYDMFSDSEKAWYDYDMLIANNYANDEQIYDELIEFCVLSLIDIVHEQVFDIDEDGRVDDYDLCLLFMYHWYENFQDIFTCDVVANLNPLNRQCMRFMRVFYKYNNIIHVSYIDVYNGKAGRYIIADTMPGRFSMYRNHKVEVPIRGVIY